MTIIAFLLGLAIRGSSLNPNDPMTWLTMGVGVGLIFLEVFLWIR